MEERDESSEKPGEEAQKPREIDLNAIFPDKKYDLNHLFPDEGTKKLLYELKRNKRDIDRFIRSFHVEDE